MGALVSDVIGGNLHELLNERGSVFRHGLIEAHSFGRNFLIPALVQTSRAAVVSKSGWMGEGST
jgi:hypothetical protein